LKIKEQKTDGEKKLVTIVIDSIAGATTKVEQESNYEKDGWSTSKAIVLSKAMRKITHLIAKERAILLITTQYREKLGITFGDNRTFSGGKALPYAASVIIDLKKAGDIKVKIDGREEVIGVLTEAKIIKNRLGPPKKKVTFEIFFDRGIDNMGIWFKTLKEYGILIQGGAWYSIIDKETGEILKKFQEKDFKNIITKEMPHLKDILYKQLCDVMIMKYKSDELDPDQIQVEESNDNIEED
jgi:recombination protein RecA